MKAIVLENAGPANNLHLENIPKPAPSAGEVLVKVKASSVNPVDIKTRNGKSLFQKLKETNRQIILGWDISGIVESIGEGVTRFKPGDEVFGMINFPGHGKAYAEYVAAPVSQLAAKPSNITHEEAAAATLAALTAWQALTTQGKLQRGQKILIHAASGGVGHYAVQFAKYLGAYVIGTSSAANKDFVLSLGADEHIDYKTQKFEDVVNEPDLILDTIGSGDYITRSLEAVKPGGTVITLPSVSAALIDDKAKQKGVRGFFFMVEENLADQEKIAELLEKSIVKSHVSQTFALKDAALAHEQIETGRTKGKIVLIP